MCNKGDLDGMENFGGENTQIQQYGIANGEEVYITVSLLRAEKCLNGNQLVICTVHTFSV